MNNCLKKENKTISDTKRVIVEDRNNRRRIGVKVSSEATLMQLIDFYDKHYVYNSAESEDKEIYKVSIFDGRNYRTVVDIRLSLRALNVKNGDVLYFYEPV